MPGVLPIEIDIPKDSPCEVLECQVPPADILISDSFTSLKQHGEVPDLSSGIPVGFPAQEHASFPFSSLLRGITNQIVWKCYPSKVRNGS